MASLANALAALGWHNPQQQGAMVRLLAFCGKAEELGARVPEGDLIGAHQAQAILRNPRLFASDAAALEWMRDSTQELFYSASDYAALKGGAGFLGENRETLLPLLQDLGLNQAKPPEREGYDFLLLPGGMEAWAETRMQQIVQLLEAGTEVKEIVLLGSNRLLLPEMEAASIIGVLAERGMAQEQVHAELDAALQDPVWADIPDVFERGTAQTKAVLHGLGLEFSDWPTEADMLEWQFSKMAQQQPELLGGLHCHTLSSAMRHRQTGEPVQENTAETVHALLQGELRRANTHDTFRDFAESAAGQKGGSVLAISHQPYALHQHGQLLSALSDAQFSSVETAAAGAQLENVNVHHALGCVAKYIYAVHDQTQARLATREQGQGR